MFDYASYAFGALVLLATIYAFPEVVFAMATFGLPFLQALFTVAGITVSISLCSSVLIVLTMVAGALKQRTFPITKITVPVFLLFSYALISLSYTPSFAYGLTKVQLLFGHILLIIMAIPCVLSSPGKLDRFFLLIPLYAMLMTGLALVSPTALISEGGSGRIAIVDIVTTAQFLAVAVFLLIYHTRPHLSLSSGNPLYLSSLVILIVSLLLTGTRAAMLGLIVAITAKQIMDGKRSIRRVSILLSLLAIPFAVYSLLGTLDFISGELADRFFNLSQLLDTNREGNYLAAMDIWLENPILGAGVGGYRDLSIRFLNPDEINPLIWVDESYGLYPHNIFLEILSELGLIGLAVFLMIGWRLYSTFATAHLQTDRIGRYKSVILGVFIICFVFASSSLDMVRNYYFWTSAGLIALIGLTSWRRHNKLSRS